MIYVNNMNCLKHLFFVSKNFIFFCQHIRIENQNYKNENTERKYLRIMRKKQFLKVKNSLQELEKDLIDLKDIELKDRETKNKREIEEPIESLLSRYQDNLETSMRGTDFISDSVKLMH